MCERVGESVSLPPPSHVPSLPLTRTAIPTGGAGVITGALSIYFTKSKGHQVSFIHATISFFLIIPMLMFLVHCPTLNLAGVTVECPDG